MLPSTRLTGTTLAVARRLAQNWVGQHLVREKTFRAYGIDKLLSLPDQARAALQFDPRPIMQAAPREWDDQQLGLPTPPANRQTTWQLRESYLSGDTTPSEVLEQLEKRLALCEFGRAVFSPFVALDIERAREAAAESTKRYKKRKTLGPLDGVPVPVKDQHLMKGLPTRGGTAYLTELSHVDGHFIRLLRGAGALIYGKTHTTEWGMNPAGINPHFDMPRNVYRSDRAAGGSSTGSAVAVALGLATVASGSDGGGSIRIPSSLNGVFGIKPTFVRIGRSHDIFGSGTVSTVGPIGQSTADLVDFLEVAACTRDPHDSTTQWAPTCEDMAEQWRAALGRGVRGCRIGIIESEWQDAHSPIASAGMQALKALEKEGAVLVNVELPLAQHAPAIGVLSIGSETMGNLTDDFINQYELMSEELRLVLHLLESLSARDYLIAQRSRESLRRAVAKALANVDVLALPSTASQAAPYSLLENRAHIADEDATRNMTRYAFLANTTGLPAGSVPVGMHDNLSMGLQFIGDAWDESSVLAVMAHCERIGLTQLPSPAGFASLG